MVGGLVLQKTQLLIPPTDTSIVISEQKQVENSPCLLPIKVKSLTEFKQVHARFIKLSLDCNPRQAGELLSICALSDWGSIDYAKSIFDSMDEQGTFDFNTMVKAYVKHSDPYSALLVFVEMLLRNVSADNFTFPFALKACVQLSKVSEGREIHSHVIKLGLEHDIYIENSLINMYGKCGEIDLASKIFYKMDEKSRTVSSWSSLLSVYRKSEMYIECLDLFEMMIKNGFRPDESSIVSVLTSCANLGTLDIGKSVHAYLLKNFTELNLVVQTSLIDMYVKCGELEKGRKIFNRMNEKNEWTYSVMISGLAMHGDGEGALDTFAKMLKSGLKPDEATYVGVLSACSHSGLLVQGLQCFDKMRFEHRISPTLKIYGCMVDLMARAGRLQEALELVKNMPMEPHDAAWRSLLSGCSAHGNLEIAEISYENLIKLGACNAGDYVMLSNIYANALRWEDSAKMRAKIVDRSLTQAPGVSKIEVKGKIHTFVSHDKSNFYSKDVYEMLHQMEWQLKFEGYFPDTSEATINVDDEDEKKRMIGGHSQKLAVAFGLLKMSHGSTIRIITNLRMSNECHKYTELISNIYEREIVVRDRHRFHQFREGKCSCGGYW